MKIYKYDENTKEYLGYMEAYLDPLESIKQKCDVYVIPPNFTTVKPEQPSEGFTAIFNSLNWEPIEDHRNTTVYNKKSGASIVIEELGPIPEGYVLEKPVFIEDLRVTAINKINLESDRARRKEYIKNGIKGSVEVLADLMLKLNNFGPFKVISIVQNEQDIQITKGELEEVIKYLYVRSMLIPQRKKELLKKVNSCRSKNKLKEFTPDFDIDEEVEELMNLSNEELNKEFSKNE